MVVGYPPGGPTDIVARIAAAEMAKVLKQSIVVDNRSGASGMIAAEFVSKAKPDGYTYLANASLHVINPSVYPSMKYDALPGVPTVADAANLPDFDVSTWYGLWAPKNTPDEVVQTLWKAASEALKEPKVIEQYAQLGAEPVASDPATFKKFNETEFEKWGKIVKLSGAKAD